MHIQSLLDLLLTISSYTMLGLGIGFGQTALIFLGIISNIIYPIFLEGFFYLIGTRVKPVDYLTELERKERKMSRLKYPIVYHPGYNFAAFGLEKLHPFDGQKYRKIFEALQKDQIIIDIAAVHQPKYLPFHLLQKIHSFSYLVRLNYSLVLTRIFELPLCSIPNPFLRWKVLDPMLLATQGTVDAGLLALIKGWSINLAGGYHHSSYHDGQGFCIYADITLCIHHLRNYHGDRVKKVMIIDIDAHQANGVEKDFVDDPDVFIVDVYNPDLYPFDFQARKAIALDIQITSDDTNSTFLKKLENNIPFAIDEFSPNFIIYIAGSDILMEDPLGGLDFDSDTLIKRDQMIFGWALSREIPITMLLGGGYKDSNAYVIADSIGNITREFRLL